MVAAATPADAQVKMHGTLTATTACPATTSIHTAANPDGAKLRVGAAYAIEGGNTAHPTHYWVVVPTANPVHRWVAIDCGTTDLKGATTPPPAADIQPTHPPGSKATLFVLAASWEPAFCERNGGKPECRSETPASFEVSHFALHGLWPEPQSNEFCGYDPADFDALDHHDWATLPPVTLPDAVRARLDQVMPGTQSHLEQHEWAKHGTCYGAGTNQAAFFTDAMNALDALNASPVLAVFNAHVGGDLDQQTVRAAFDQAFGAGAGARVGFTCGSDRGRNLHMELDINLAGDVHNSHDLGALILAAPPHVVDRHYDCPVDHAIVDAYGDQ
jgi:ribonuclease T2